MITPQLQDCPGVLWPATSLSLSSTTYIAVFPLSLCLIILQAEVNIQVGTFLHELGHNLGLVHGSVDDISYKPNHMSIMNYNYQIAGVRSKYGDNLHFSSVTCNDLDEAALDELDGKIEAQYHH